MCSSQRRLLVFAVNLYLLVLPSKVCANNTYTAYVPKFVRPGFDVSYTLAILKSSNPIQVSSTFTSSDQQVQLASSDLINNGESKHISMGVVPIEFDGASRFELSTKGIDSVTGDVVFSNSTSDFTFAPKSISILIQTDKAIYQPAQTIKFRAICLLPNMRPLNGSVEYQVEDPKGNVIMLNQAGQLQHGVVGDELQLHKDAAVGDWKVTFTAHGYKKQLAVTVKHYKLPKFEVELETPVYIHPGSAGATIKLKATYTYGKPVRGVGKLTVNVKNRYVPFFFYDPRPVTSIFGPDIPAPDRNNHIFDNFDGEAELHLSMQQLEELGWIRGREMQLKVFGEVTEEFTRISFNSTAEVDIKRTNIKVAVEYKPEMIKPGLSYTAYVKVSEQDGKPLMESDRLSNNLIVVVSYEYPYYHTWPGLEVDDSDANATGPERPRYRPPTEATHVLTIPPSGIVPVTVEIRNDGFNRISFQPYTNATATINKWAAQWDVHAAESPSNSFLQITTDDSNVEPGSSADLLIRTTEPISLLRVMVLARGQVISDETMTSPEASTSHRYQLTTTHDMMPAAKVLASYVRHDGEIVADYIRVVVEVAFENQVTLTSSAASVDAGDDVTINVRTSPGAYVGVRAIDKSVLLLKSGNDITKDRVAQDLNEYSSNDNNVDDSWFGWWWPRPSGASDADEVFRDADLIVMTDALLHKKTSSMFIGIGGGMVFMGSLRRKISSISVKQRSSVSPPPRSFFPETWLWKGELSGADGLASFSTTAPDTITSWILSAFSVSHQYGLGLTDPLRVTVFRTFFINLNLPLKVTRGEVIVIQAVVFNYFKTDLAVELTLTTNDKFELIRPGSDPSVTGPVRQFTVDADSAYSVWFPVRVTALGDVPFTVSAQSELAGDALQRSVFVRPEGVPQCYSSSSLFRRENDRDPATSSRLEVRIPPNIVPGSATVKLFVYGDIMGSTANNLGSLLREPGGCGEQNMITFAPDVFVTRYLDTAGRLDAETRAKAYKHFVEGYQNQLNYKHRDGSFSAFGSRDKSGSTWLTAFVAKCFIYAGQVRSDLDTQLSSNIRDSLDFLVAQQNEDGSFREPGKVSHKAMQGGVDGPTTMTAYVLITMRETSFAARIAEVTAASERARAFLENQLDSVKRNAYTLAIVTYALQVSDSSRAAESLSALEALATTGDGLTYWQDSDTDTNDAGPGWRRPYYQPPSQDIEMTSYALLTYVRRDDLDSAAPVMKWLASKRNDLGAYSSTQNTVIAIQAMSEVAAMLVGQVQDLTVTGSHTGAPEFALDVRVDQSNVVVFNRFDLPVVDGDVEVEAQGTGVAVAQLSVCYNTVETPYSSEPFDCNFDISDDGMDKAQINFCCRLKPDAVSATGMFLFEIKLPNGFTIDLAKELERNNKAQRVEHEKGGANIYFDQLAPGEELCAVVELVRYQMVAEVKAATLKAYEYYEPDKQVMRSYRVASFEDAGACHVCGMQCAGCPEPRLTDWRLADPAGKNCDQTFCRHDDNIIYTELVVRQCVDPNNGMVIEGHHCGVQTLPTYMRICNGTMLPVCPDARVGLWENVPAALAPAWERGYFPPMRDVPELSWLRPDTAVLRHVTPCYSLPSRPTTDEPGFQGVPGTSIVDDDRRIECPSLVLDSRQGFTLSLLINIESWHRDRKSVIFSYGDIGLTSKPLFNLERVYWNTAFESAVRFRGRLNGIKYIMKDFDGSVLVGRWNHIVLTLSRDVMKLYINGESVDAYSYAYNVAPKPPPKFAVLRIGQGASRNQQYHGALRAHVSSFAMWHHSLDQQQVRQVYEFHQPLLSGQDSPVIPARLLRYLSPPYFHAGTCFNRARSLQELIGFGQRCPAPKFSFPAE